MEKQRIGNTKELSEEERIKIIERSSRTVGRAVFFSILVTLISFAPILFLEGQEKKLFLYNLTISMPSLRSYSQLYAKISRIRTGNTSFA